MKRGKFPFSYFQRHSNVQVTYVHARVYLNAHTIYTYNSGYNVPYFTSKQPASRTFPPPPGHLLLRGKLGYLVARIAAAFTSFAHTNVVGSRATGDIQRSICTFSSFILARSCSHPSLYRFLFIFLSFFFSVFTSTWCHFKSANK